MSDMRDVSGFVVMEGVEPMHSEDYMIQIDVAGGQILARVPTAGGFLKPHVNCDLVEWAVLRDYVDNCVALYRKENGLDD